MVEPHQYYDNMSKREMEEHLWLIVIIEAACYCELRHMDYIGYSHLRTRSSERINVITRGKKSEVGGGTFASIIDSLSNPSKSRKDRFLTRRRIKVRGKKETHIYPNIPLIQAEVKARQAENLDDGDNKILVARNKGDTLARHKPITDSSVTISEFMARQTAKTRSLSDSPSVYERLVLVVTHAKPKKVSKK